MDIKVIRAFFKWCTIFNGALLILYALLIRYAGDWVYGVNFQWIPIPRDAFVVATYGLLGFLKLIVLVFNLVPYLALVIIGRDRASNVRAE